MSCRPACLTDLWNLVQTVRLHPLLARTGFPFNPMDYFWKMLSTKAQREPDGHVYANRIYESGY